MAGGGEIGRFFAISGGVITCEVGKRTGNGDCWMLLDTASLVEPVGSTFEILVVGRFALGCEAVGVV